MSKKMQNEFEYLEKFQVYTNYFLSCETDCQNFSSENCNLVFIKIFNSILFESDEKIKSKKVAYLVFWLNFIIELRNRQIEEPLLTTILTIIDKLDLQQLIKYTSKLLPFDFSAEINYEVRKVFDNETALTDAQIDILLSILARKNIIISAPTSYGKTGTVLKSLLVALGKGIIKNFIVILPTKSLINEYRKNINSYFNNQLDQIVITETPYMRPEPEKAIFLFTQERFLIYNNSFPDYKFDYVVLDEVQDLINVVKVSDNERSILLAKAIAVLDSQNVPMAFLMPYINAPYNSFIEKFIDLDLNNTLIIDELYSPTSSIKYLIKKENNTFNLYDVTYNRGFFNESKQIKLDIQDVSPGETFDSIKYDLYKICASHEINSLKEKNIYFCKKNDVSDIAELFAINILLDGQECSNKRKRALIRYLSDYIDEHFELIEFLKKGIAIHTGDLDTFTKRQIETIFAEEKSGINHIFCTNTLLKGVNLNANNLFFLAKKGRFDNAELDKKNLLGRVGRLGNCLQGRIFRFFVETKNLKFDTIRRELNSSSEPCEFSAKKFALPTEDKQSPALKTYLSDKKIKNRITEGYIKTTTEYNCFDYFLGFEESKKVQRKIEQKTNAEILEMVAALKLSNYECYEKVVAILADIYEWSNSSDDILSKRMTKHRFIARLFYNVAIGTTIKKLVQSSLEISVKNNEKPYIITTIRRHEEVWFLSPIEHDDLINRGFRIRDYTDKDRNKLIYSTMSDVSNLIEFRLKKYLQDLYYRLSQLTGTHLKDLESFLTHSIVGNPKKIGLKNIGIVDEFAIDALCEQPHLFDDQDYPIISQIRNFAVSLDDTDPVKYSIQDVFGK